MKKLNFCLISLFLTLTLIACSSDDESEKANTENDSTNEEVDNEETDENKEEEINEEPDEESLSEDDNEVNEEEGSEEDQQAKERLLERYPDDLRLGDSEEWERSDGLSTDHIRSTLNSFKLVSEVNGEKPENDYFLLANVTLENLLGDYSYEKNIITALAEGREGVTVQNEKEELSLELNEEEAGISTGDVVFDVEESDYYRISILDEFYIVFTDEQSDSE